MKLNKSVAGEPLPCSISLDGYYKQVLDDQHVFRLKNFDVVAMITGEEGSGKTTLAFQSALYMDHHFNNDHIVFNAQQFEEVIERLPKGSAIVWDEADDVGSNWASEMMVALKKTFKRIRKKNLIIFLVTPTFHDLNKYFAIHRTRFLINVYTDFVTRGFFKLYNRDAKRKLYIYGKKEMNMSAAKSTFFGRFTNYPEGFPVDMDAYELEKDRATAETFEKVTTPKNIRMDILLNLIAHFDKEKIPYTNKVLAPIIGVDNSTIGKYLKQYRGGV